MTEIKSLECDQLDYRDLAKGRQLRVHELVREYHFITTSGIARSNPKLLDTFLKHPLYRIGHWVWV